MLFPRLQAIAMHPFILSKSPTGYRVDDDDDDDDENENDDGG